MRAEGTAIYKGECNIGQRLPRHSASRNVVVFLTFNKQNQTLKTKLSLRAESTAIYKGGCTKIVCIKLVCIMQANPVCVATLTGNQETSPMQKESAILIGSKLGWLFIYFKISLSQFKMTTCNVTLPF